MRALRWYGSDALRVETADDPVLVDPRDAILAVRRSSVCGSDLPLLENGVLDVRAGTILGREFVGEIVETGAAVAVFRPGDRVAIHPRVICGTCPACRQGRPGACSGGTQAGRAGSDLFGYPAPRVFGGGQIFGGLPGGHATFVRVPAVDHNAVALPDDVDDATAVFLAGPCLSGFALARTAAIRPGDIVAVWGCGAVGLMTMQAAWRRGASRVFAIDRLDCRLAVAGSLCGAETLNYERTDVYEALMTATAGRGPARCLDCVGVEKDAGAPSRAGSPLSSDRISALRQAIFCCRPHGTVAVAGACTLMVDKFPAGAAAVKSLSLRFNWYEGRNLLPSLIDLARTGALDPRPLATHVLPLERGAEAYEVFRKRQDGCIRAVLIP